MQDIKGAKSLISKEKYKQAGILIDKLIRKKETHELWYLRGLVSLKMKNYDYAIGCFERALALKKNYLYFRMMGVARMERFELEVAVTDFDKALNLAPNDHLSNFYAAICYMFMDNMKSAKYLRKAYSLNKKKTKELLNNFYIMFFRKDPLVSKAIKDNMKRNIQNIKTN
jgi:tetratricopeptide (TPR) repeat protein